MAVLAHKEAHCMATSQQNEAIGKFELIQLERKRKLLEGIRAESRWAKISGFLLPLCIYIIAMLSNHFFPNNYQLMLLLSLLPVIAAISRTAGSAHTRLNALIKLIGEENLLGEKK